MDKIGIDIRLLQGSAAIDRMRGEIEDLISLLRCGLKNCKDSKEVLIVICDTTDARWSINTRSSTFCCTIGDHSELSDSCYLNWINRTNLSSPSESLTMKVRQSMSKLIEVLFKEVPGLEESLKPFLEATD